MNAPVAIAAGGTGGHVYPALAVAAELRSRTVPVVWLGTSAGLEARVVPAAGIELETLRVGGLRGKGWRTRVAAPVSLARACWQAGAILRRQRPRALLGMGGFAAGPAGLMAALGRCPLVIHEQNAAPGLTNRLLARPAQRVLEAIPGTFPAARGAIATGNPVRAEIAALPPPEERFAARSGPVRLLVLGGSQGARWLNERLPQVLARLEPQQRPEVTHVGGPQQWQRARAAYDAAGVAATVVPYIEDMAGALAAADVAIARAGAMTVAELASAGLGALLIPYPHAVDDHQARNAEWLARAGAARVVRESALDDDRLEAELRALLGTRAALLERARCAHAVARPDAARAVADQILEVAR